MEDMENSQYFDGYALPDVSPPNTGIFFSDCECNEFVAEGGDKSNNDLSHTLHLNIP